MKLSIIIATCNRSTRIVASLEAARRSIDIAGIARDAEIVVVDNASTDDTSAVVREWIAGIDLMVQLVLEPKRGLSAARNAGISASAGDLVVFTDDDCCLSEEYIVELLRYDAMDRGLVMRSGSVVLGDPADLPITIKSVAAVRRWQKPMSLKDEGDILGKSLIGCNMAMRRDVFRLIGPFDEKLGAGVSCSAGEDSDYFYRAYLAGVVLEVVPDLVVSHFHGRRSVKERIKLIRNYSIGNGALAFKYIFIYPRFSRHFVWSARACLDDFIRLDRSGNVPSNFDKLIHMLKGACSYAYASFAGFASSRFRTVRKADRRR